MKFKVGEFVRFVEERREGYITRLIDDKTIAVTDEDGFEIPVLASEVTRIYGGQHAEQAEIIPTSSHNFIAEGIHIAIETDKKVRQVVHFSVINRSSYELLYTLSVQKKHSFRGEKHGILKPQSSDRVYAASLAEIDQWPTLHFHILRFSQQESSAAPPPLTYSHKFKAQDFSAQPGQAKELENPAWLIQLDPSAPIIDAKKLRESFYKRSEEKTSITVPKPGHEIDLHIDKLRSDYDVLNNNEILEIQLDHFHKFLDAAIIHRMDSVIVIHGSGNGVLRNYIHKAAGKHPNVRTFKDAHKERFGYGATEIFIK